MEQFYPYHFNRSHTIYTVSRIHMPELLKEFRGIDENNIDNAASAAQQAYHEEMSRRRLTADLLQNGPKESAVINEYITLKQHQQLARELAKVNDKYAFFYDTRTGKTALSLSIINDDLAEHPEHKWLIICPLYLINRAWLKDRDDFFKNMYIVNCYAKTKQARIDKIFSIGNVYITNTESFITYREYFEKLHFHGCFVDESSDLKSNKSKVSEEVVNFALNLQRFYLLSGTPAPNGEHEYYMQLRCIDYYGIQQSYSQFTNRYFYDTSRNHHYQKWVLLPHKKDELDKLIARYAIYVDKEDVLDTPGRSFEEVSFSLPDDIHQQYNLLKNELYVQLQNERKITVANVAAKINKLNQVSSGFIIDTKAVKENKFFGEDKQEVYLLSYYRFEKLKELLDSFGNEQVIIWAYYRKEIETIAEMLGNKCAYVYGGLTPEKKDNAIVSYMNKQVQYLVAHPDSCGKGLTMVVGHIAVYFSLNYSFESFKQSYDRIYADKAIQPHFCKYYIMLARGTIEPLIYKNVLLGKQDVCMVTLNHLKSAAI